MSLLGYSRSFLFVCSPFHLFVSHQNRTSTSSMFTGRAALWYFLWCELHSEHLCSATRGTLYISLLCFFLARSASNCSLCIYHPGSFEWARLRVFALFGYSLHLYVLSPGLCCGEEEPTDCQSRNNSARVHRWGHVGDRADILVHCQ